MAIRILEKDAREQYEARRRETVLSHTSVIQNGLLEAPGAQEERERKARRDARAEAREAADRMKPESEFGRLKGEDDYDTPSTLVGAEMSTVSGVSSDSSIVLTSQRVSEILERMQLLQKDANAQVVGCQKLVDMVVPGGADGAIGIGGRCHHSSDTGEAKDAEHKAPGLAPNFGGWAGPQAVVGEAGAIEIVLEAMRVHTTSAAVRLAGVQLLGALALGNPTNRKRIGCTRGIEAIMDALLWGVRPDMSDLRNRSLTAAGCLALRNVAVGHADNLKLLVASKGIQFLIAALRAFSDSQDVQVGAVLVCSTCTPLHAPALTCMHTFAQEGAMGLLRSIAQSNLDWRKSIDNLGYSRLLRSQAASTNVFPVGAGSISLCVLACVRSTAT
jgi:hypothetical protein